MSSSALLKPTLHVEILLKGKDPRPKTSHDICVEVSDHIGEDYAKVAAGQQIEGFGIFEGAVVLPGVLADTPQELTGMGRPSSKSSSQATLVRKSKPNCTA